MNTAVIISIADHLRAIFADRLQDVWGFDTASIIRSRCTQLTDRELRIAASTFMKQEMHSAANREQIVRTLDTHLKHFTVRNINAITGRRF
tara:strand:- start:1355 stop:1627 length:273 start_codon:yes stop_codon:yes gene_type:complete